ncbi:hypothetical protein P7K49_027659, partial [Saguinus oedipus]
RQEFLRRQTSEEASTVSSMLFQKCLCLRPEFAAFRNPHKVQGQACTPNTQDIW